MNSCLKWMITQTVKVIPLWIIENIVCTKKLTPIFLNIYTYIFLNNMLNIK